jgi:hypothetical protein
VRFGEPSVDLAVRWPHELKVQELCERHAIERRSVIMKVVFAREPQAVCIYGVAVSEVVTRPEKLTI